MQFSHLTPRQIGAVHEGDKAFMLNYFSHNLDGYLNETDYAMGRMASSYLINFCKYGDPNGKNLPVYEKTKGDTRYFELGDYPQMRTFDSDKYQKIIDKLKENYDLDFIDE